MDLSKIGTNLWIAIGGTVAVFLGIVVFAWYSVTVGPFSASVYAWDVNFIGKLAFLGMLVMIAAVVLMVLPNPPELPIPFPPNVLLLGAGAFTALMVVIEFIDHHSYTSFGLYLSLIGAIAAAYGAFAMGARLNMPSGSSS
jgi:hypothetical protein